MSEAERGLGGDVGADFPGVDEEALECVLRGSVTRALIWVSHNDELWFRCLPFPVIRDITHIAVHITDHYYRISTHDTLRPSQNPN